jgi:hypothetical protein
MPSLADINWILSPDIFGLPIISIWGLLTMALIIYYRQRPQLISRIIICLWLPWLIWLATYQWPMINNFHDGKQIQRRFCSLSADELNKAKLCQLAQIIQSVRANYPAQSKLYLAINPAYKPFLYYYLIDRFRLVASTEEADYIINQESGD